ncbi:ANTAR domain-containing response regulator [Devosia sp. SL43]|uniref:ANTAR domain-containing response regulator n=1 Tax=Devosia sp. SL43 TaxID=2806348 RepID=UPI001F245AF2|nr:ANTAR domain-containing protein [Devosia sp. SL43]UJW87479.1 ANTAR domain-containing protein [Devosia sp. SL43]
MSRPVPTPNFDGRRALIVHRPHVLVDAIARQLAQLGIRHEVIWPDLPAGFVADASDLLFYDADMGHDGQFPWEAGHIPMPAVALIGSEAPGRLAWAIRMGADAHLLKPVGSGGVFSALVIATEAFARRSSLHQELDGLRSRLDRRQVVAEATACLMLQDNLSAGAAYAILRRDAMLSRLSIEDMAERIVSQLRGGHVRHRP